MSLLSGFLSIGDKFKPPKVRKAGSLEMDDYEYGIDAYLKQLEKKSGFEDTIVTRGDWRKVKKPGLGSKNYLGAVAV